MKRWRYVRRLATVLLSCALTLGFLLNAFSAAPGSHAVKSQSIPSPEMNLLQGDSEWIVLPGNITVHKGLAYNPHDFKYVINSHERCTDFHPDKQGLLIMIESNADNQERRTAIRETWGQWSLQVALNFRIIFLLAKSSNESTQSQLIQESFKYGDIVQENFQESFYNLSLKSIMGLKWTCNFCSNASYILKTDDDIFIHVPNLLIVLSEFQYKEKDSLLCHTNRFRRILRKDTLMSIPHHYKKYFVEHQQLPGNFFPEYCSGFAYAFTIDVARKLYASSLVTPLFFIEDVYISSFCRLKAKVKIFEHASLTLQPRLTVEQSSCAFKEGRVTSQEVPPSVMRAMWNEVNTQGFFCPRLISQP